MPKIPKSCCGVGTDNDIVGMSINEKGKICMSHDEVDTEALDKPDFASCQSEFSCASALAAAFSAAVLLGPLRAFLVVELGQHELGQHELSNFTAGVEGGVLVVAAIGVDEAVGVEVMDIVEADEVVDVRSASFGSSSLSSRLVGILPRLAKAVVGVEA